MTDQELQELRLRNAQRAQQKIQELVDKYLCHPSNQMTQAKIRKILRTSKKAQLNH